MANETNTPMFQLREDGQYLVSAAGVLLAAHTLHGDPAESTPEGMGRAQALIREALAAAHAKGYRRGEIAETELAGPELRRRAVVAQEIVDHLDAAAWADVLHRAGWR